MSRAMVRTGARGSGGQKPPPVPAYNGGDDPVAQRYAKPPKPPKPSGGGSVPAYAPGKPHQTTWQGNGAQPVPKQLQGAWPATPAVEGSTPTQQIVNWAQREQLAKKKAAQTVVMPYGYNPLRGDDSASVRYKKPDLTAKYRGDGQVRERYQSPDARANPPPPGYANWREWFLAGGRLREPRPDDPAGVSGRRWGGVIEPWFEYDLPQAPQTYDVSPAVVPSYDGGGGGGYTYEDWGGGGGGWGGGGGGGWGDNQQWYNQGLLNWRY